MAQEYWVKVQGDDTEYGPYTGHQLKEYAATGQLSPDSLVSLDHATWYPARRIKNLFAPVAPAAVPRHADYQGHVDDAVVAAPQPAHVPSAHPTSQAMAGAIQYSVPSSRRGLTPDQRYRGVMLFLYITALALGLLLFLVGVVTVFALFLAAQHHYASVADTALVLPGGIILSSALFCAAGLLGILKFRVEFLLGIAAIIFILARVGNFGLSLFVENVDWPEGQADNWARTVAESGRLALSLAFPILCLLGIASLWRGRKKKDSSSTASPWAALVYGISAVAIVSGVIMVVRYGQPVIEYRQFATGTVPGLPSDLRIVGEPSFNEQIAAMRKEIWWSSLAALLMSTVLILGGIITLISTRGGRFILLAGAAGLLVFAIFVLVQGTHYRGPNNTVNAHVDDVVPLLPFFILAAIVLIFAGRPKSRPVPV